MTTGTATTIAITITLYTPYNHYTTVTSDCHHRHHRHLSIPFS